MIWFMIIAHCFADMALQPSFIAHNKDKRFILMFFHALMVTGSVTIPVFIFGTLTLNVVLVLLLSHIVIDSWKSRQPKDDKHFWCIYVDQGLHLLFIIIAAFMGGVPFVF